MSVKEVGIDEVSEELSTEFSALARLLRLGIGSNKLEIETANCWELVILTEVISLRGIWVVISVSVVPYRS
jgi:hypothetical protein